MSVLSAPEVLDNSQPLKGTHWLSSDFTCSRAYLMSDASQAAAHFQPLFMTWVNAIKTATIAAALIASRIAKSPVRAATPGAAVGARCIRGRRKLGLGSGCGHLV